MFSENRAPLISFSRSCQSSSSNYPVSLLNQLMQPSPVPLLIRLQPLISLISFQFICKCRKIVVIGEFNRNPNHLQHVSFLLKYLTFYYDSETSVGITLWKDVMNPAICRQLPGPAPCTWPIPITSQERRQMCRMNSG